MYENQFIQFTQAIDPLDSCMPLPVVFGGTGISFFCPVWNNPVFTVVNEQGEPILRNDEPLEGSFARITNNHARALFGDYTYQDWIRHNAILRASDARLYIAPDDCFRIRLKDGDNIYYSSLLRRYDNEQGEFAQITYTCHEEEFELPFNTQITLRQWMPVWLDKPALKQKDEIYETLSGERKILYATISKEWQAQTDYIPEEWHERLLIALSCDYVRINGVLLTKSDNYDIDWDNYIEADCGKKLAKATWKMAANVTQRNSNN